MTTILMAILSFGLIDAPAPGASPAASDIDSAPSIEVVAANQEVGEPEAQVLSGLPQRPAEPRTMQRYWPVFGAFVLAWMGIMAYMLSFGRSLRDISGALQQLESEQGDR